MTNPKSRETAPQDLDCGFDALRGDCAEMADRWPGAPAEKKTGHGEKARIENIVVPERSAHLVEGMSEYGD
ncbi:hypothetical protein HUT18_06245 [Streptomyces sp. NA04227]|uniref:hypothetical protein n=1 Tax=Streptomyces sp. NA04227 TaxID=2742136 RepID=UPI001591A285|nr:hypothetical protein [Streptomyces sp. NA04227]QKW06060.1 hypothetical protein HUT18_06245 [Streptomyces sp. NA04227]